MAQTSPVHAASRRGFQFLTIAALAACGLAAPIFAGPSDEAVSGPVAAVFPPWWTDARALAAAAEGGDALGLGMGAFVVLVAPRGPEGRSRLRAAGAWLLLDARGFAGCDTTAAPRG